MDSLEKLKRAIIAQVKGHVPVQTVWATCASVNVSDGTMVATREGLDYEDVLLGIGGEGDLVVPLAGSKVLLGIVENKPTAAFLLMAERVERRHINGDAHGGLVLADQVASRLNTLEQDLNTLKQVLAAWVPVPSDGGAALKAAAATWAAGLLTPTQSQALQNTVVHHG
jgi:hypothetical protein